MKKILFLVNHDIVIYNFRLELIERLLNEGYEVHISSPYGEKIDELIAMGCIYHEIIIERRGTNIVKDIHIITNYFKLMRLVQPRVVLTYTIKPNIYGGLVCRLLKIPYLTNITGLGSGVSSNSILLIRNLLNILYKVSLKDSKCVFFQNKDNQNVFLSKKIKIKKYKLLPGSGVNTDRFIYSEYPKGSKINIYYFGRLMEEKGTYELLEVVKRIKKKYDNVLFHFVGFSEDLELTKIINLYHKDGIINYHGYKKDIKKYLIHSDAVIQPTHHEGMSNVLLEASATGRPILASNIPGCSEIVEHAKTGYLFDVKNVDSMINMIEKFIQLPIENKKQMGENGRKKVINEFSREIVVEEYIKEIKAIN